MGEIASEYMKCYFDEWDNFNLGELSWAQVALPRTMSVSYPVKWKFSPLADEGGLLSGCFHC